MLRGFIALAMFALSANAAAHGGGLDKNGCHHDRKNGGYHCHRSAPAGGAPRPRADAHALQREASSAGPFSSCAQAREAGAAPVRLGDPGYSRRLDRDGDGIGCE